MRYWLMKSEPDDVSIDDLAAMPKKTVAWYGVRNYTARNFMRDQMQVGDQAFFYHSSCPEPGIAGIVRISKPAYPDATQFDAKLNLPAFRNIHLSGSGALDRRNGRLTFAPMGCTDIDIGANELPDVVTSRSGVMPSHEIVTRHGRPMAIFSMRV
jgi:hypothetical protein